MQAEVVAGILQHVGSLLTSKQVQTVSMWLNSACELNMGKRQHMGLVKVLFHGLFMLSGAAYDSSWISSM